MVAKTFATIYHIMCTQLILVEGNHTHYMEHACDLRIDLNDGGGAAV